MGAKVTQAEVLAQIAKTRARDIRSALRRGEVMVDYSYSDFKKDMRGSDLLVDRTTIRDKWSMLVDNSVVIEHGRWTKRRDNVSAYLSIYRLEDRLDTECRAMLESNMANRRSTCGERDTHITTARLPPTPTCGERDTSEVDA